MLQKMIDESSHIVFFGGAGVSTESGIPDFRSKDGLFRQKYTLTRSAGSEGACAAGRGIRGLLNRYRYSPQRILSKPFYQSKTEEFYEFYRNKMLWPDAKPNKAHKKLAELEAAGKLTAVITQNIDGLHQAAGSKKVLELHGSVHRNYCKRCGKLYDMEYMLRTSGVPVCECGGIIKPDVVLYQEKLDYKIIAEAVRCMREADMLIIGGTSLSVAPASKIIRHFKGINRVLINKNVSGLENLARFVISDSIGEVLDRVKVVQNIDKAGSDIFEGAGDALKGEKEYGECKAVG